MIVFVHLWLNGALGDDLLTEEGDSFVNGGVLGVDLMSKLKVVHCQMQLAIALVRFAPNQQSLNTAGLALDDFVHYRNGHTELLQLDVRDGRHKVTISHNIEYLQVGFYDMGESEGRLALLLEQLGALLSTVESIKELILDVEVHSFVKKLLSFQQGGWSHFKLDFCSLA